MTVSPRLAIRGPLRWGYRPVAIAKGAVTVEVRDPTVTDAGRFAWPVSTLAIGGYNRFSAPPA
jgi:hypothetical protein